LEVLITTAIFVIVLYAVYLVYDVGEANYTTGSRQWDVQSQARVGLERMGREIRMAGYASPTKVTDQVVIATNDTFSFHADLDGTGDKYITYSRRDCSGTVGTTLYRKVSAGPLASATFCGGDPFVDGVSGLAFTFYELNNVSLPYPPTSTYQLDSQAAVTGSNVPTAPAAAGQRDSIRQVKITLTIQQQVRGETLPYTATTDVALRNLIP
jgi:hypothetical protein